MPTIILSASMQNYCPSSSLTTKRLHQVKLFEGLQIGGYDWTNVFFLNNHIIAYLLPDGSSISMNSPITLHKYMNDTIFYYFISCPNSMTYI